MERDGGRCRERERETETHHQLSSISFQVSLSLLTIKSRNHASSMQYIELAPAPSACMGSWLKAVVVRKPKRCWILSPKLQAPKQHVPASECILPAWGRAGTAPPLASAIAGIQLEFVGMPSAESSWAWKISASSRQCGAQLRLPVRHSAGTRGARAVNKGGKSRLNEKYN